MDFHKKPTESQLSQQESDFQDRLEREPLEKGDIPAMIIAGFIVVLPLLLGLSAMVFFAYWLVAGRG